MSDAIRMRITNLDQFRRKLRRLRDAARGEALREAVLAGGQVLEGEVKKNIQEQELIDEGNLLNSVQVEVVEATADRAVANVGTHVPYGPIHEFGGTIQPVSAAALHWVGEDGEHHVAQAVTIPARPYLRPAFDEGIDKAVRAMEASIGRSIEEAE